MTLGSRIVPLEVMDKPIENENQEREREKTQRLLPCAGEKNRSLSDPTNVFLLGLKKESIVRNNRVRSFHGPLEFPQIRSFSE
jgi:hypothetical protein